jgi:hypothetical protein
MKNQVDQAITLPPPSPDLTSKIMIMGELLSEANYNSLSNITEADLKAIAEDWESIAPDEFKNLLDAELA